MKKIFFLIISLFLGLTLSACSDNSNIKMVGPDGNEIEFKIEETDDKDVVENSLYYVLSANYNEIKKFEVDLDATVNLDLKQSTMDIKGNFEVDADLLFDREALNATVEGDGNITMGMAQQSQTSEAEVKLQYFAERNDDYQYLDLELKAPMMNKTEKTKSIGEDIFTIFDQALNLKQEELNEMFTELKVAIAEQGIMIKITEVTKDTFTYSISVEHNKQKLEYSFTYDLKTAHIKKVELKQISITLSDTDIEGKVTLSASAEVKYNTDETIKKLSAKEKAQYL